MACSKGTHLSFWDLPQTSYCLKTFKGRFFILLLSLCLLAECEGTRKVRETVTLLKENYRTQVTFDPTTAHKQLFVSEDRTYVESRSKPQNVPDNPERFSQIPALLGLPGFTSGKHYWEVEYGDQREWAVGVTVEDVGRKIFLMMVPEEEIWQEGRWWLRALEYRSPTSPTSSGIIGVFLDYEAATVNFYIEGKVIMKKAFFSGQKVYPFFYLRGNVHLKIVTGN